MNLADIARTWQRAGVSVVPILANQTKRAAVEWAPFQVKAPDLNQVEEWWGNGKQYGLALICGSVSGNLEMTEIEGRACGVDSMTRIQEEMDRAGLAQLWAHLTGPQGYSEMSPSGGLHLLYRVSDHPIPGNSKIARDENRIVLAETRGEGGYVIVAPTPGMCHPSGESWIILQGRYGSLPVIGWEDRCRLHEALYLALNTESVPVQAPAALSVSPPSSRMSAAGLSPGDDFEASASWDEILTPHGWRDVGRRGDERLWVRPGKDPRDGHSATTGYAKDRDRLFVFSTSTIFPTEQSLTKFAAHTILNHGGDYHAAAVALRRQGFGETTQELDVLKIAHKPQAEDDPEYPINDTGNAMYLHDAVKGRFLYVADEKEYVYWTGTHWARDQKTALAHEFMTLAMERCQRAQLTGDGAAVKWWTKAGDSSRIDAALKCVRNLPGFTVTSDELNQDRHVINLGNGTYNLQTHTLAPHDPDQRITRVMGASYDPDATCPQFEGFMERVLPDPEMRSYVQRALGYSLLGDADQRSLFLVCGPSGTGKSTLMATMEMLFADYGVSAPSGTLRARGTEGSSPSNDLHTLRGKRFVSTSETNEHTAYNEDLIKRLTGRDQIQSRELYQKYQHWSPRCTIWLATNHPPRFSSDDDAIWRRAKVVPFNTVLLDEDEVPDFAHNVLSHERDGILNWLLAGLMDYQIRGLAEPERVQKECREVRLMSDPVSRFLEDTFSDGVLTRGEDLRIQSRHLYQMYSEWARQLGERSLGSRRFTMRMLSSYQDLSSARIGGNYFYLGLGRSSAVLALGHHWGATD